MNHLLNTKSNKHILHMIAYTAIVCIVILAIISIYITLDRINILENNVETYKELLLDKQLEHSIEILALKDNQEEQSILDASFNKRIEANHTSNNENLSRIVNNSIDIDNISYERFVIDIEEIWTEINYIKKVIK